MAFQKLSAFTQKVSDLADKPALTPTALKAQFDAAPNELKDSFNNLIDALKLTTSGDSGAKNIGATTISGLTGSDVQTILSSLYGKFNDYTTKTNMKRTSFATPTLKNGWTNDASFSLQYTYNPIGYLHIVGTVTSGTLTNGTTIATIDGYVAAKTFITPVLNNSNTVHLYVTDNGAGGTDIRTYGTWTAGNVTIDKMIGVAIIPL